MYSHDVLQRNRKRLVFLECLLNINGYIESGFVLVYRQLNYYGLFVDEIYISM